MNFNERFLIITKIILPIVGEPIQNSGLIVNNGQIEEIIPNLSDYQELKALPEKILKFPNSILMPGLINLHTHLDYSLIKLKSQKLFDWIKDLVVVSRKYSQEDFIQANYEGFKQAILTGTTTIVDCSYTGNSYKPMVDFGTKSIIALEIFGIDPSASKATFEAFKGKIEAIQAKIKAIDPAGLDNIILTISPHAIYTVGLKLWRLARNWCKENNTILVSHLSESRHEIDWCMDNDLTLDEHLTRAFNLPNDYRFDSNNLARQSGLSPLQYLSQHNLVDGQILFAHGVHLNNEDVAIIKEKNLKLAICPRSNKHLKVGNFKRGYLSEVQYGLGTDSLASNHDLDMLKEANYFSKNVDSKAYLTPEEVLKAITINAAKYLNLGDCIGSIEVGKRADFILLDRLNEDTKSTLTSDDANRLYKDILDLKYSVSNVFIAGRQVVAGRKVNI